MRIEEKHVDVSKAKENPTFQAVHDGYILIINQMGMGFVLQAARGGDRVFKSLTYMTGFVSRLGFNGFTVNINEATA